MLSFLLIFFFGVLPVVVFALPINKNNLKLSDCTVNCFCPGTWSPVCGTDQITYSNECSLECMKCANPDLQIKYRGECKKGLSKNTISKNGIFSPNNSESTRGSAQENINENTKYNARAHEISRRKENRKKREDIVTKNLCENLKSIIQINEDINKETVQAQEEYMANNEPAVNYSVDMPIQRNNLPTLDTKFQQKIIRALLDLRRVNEELEIVRIAKRRVVNNLDILASTMSNPTQDLLIKDSMNDRNPSVFVKIIDDEDKTVLSNESSREEKSISVNNKFRAETTTVRSQSNQNIQDLLQEELTSELGNDVPKELKQNENEPMTIKSEGDIQNTNNDIAQIESEFEYNKEFENGFLETKNSKENEIEKIKYEAEEDNTNNQLPNKPETLEVLDTSSQIQEEPYSEYPSDNSGGSEENLKLEPTLVSDMDELQTTNERNSNAITGILMKENNEANEIEATTEVVTNNNELKRIFELKAEAPENLFEVEAISKIETTTPENNNDEINLIREQNKEVPYEMSTTENEVLSNNESRVPAEITQNLNKQTIFFQSSETKSADDGKSAEVEKSAEEGKFAIEGKSEENRAPNESDEVSTVSNSSDPNTTSKPKQKKFPEDSNELLMSSTVENISNVASRESPETVSEENRTENPTTTTNRAQDETSTMSKSTTEPTSSTNTLPEQTTESEDRSLTTTTTESTRLFSLWG